MKDIQKKADDAHLALAVLLGLGGYGHQEMTTFGHQVPVTSSSASIAHPRAVQSMPISTGTDAAVSGNDL